MESRAKGSTFHWRMASGCVDWILVPIPPLNRVCRQACVCVYADVVHHLERKNTLSFFLLSLQTITLYTYNE